MTMTADVSRRSDFEDGNGHDSGGMIEVAQSRAAQEVQAAMAVAKRFPRDEIRSFDRIIKACKRKALAESSMYAYPKGGTTVTGPSIRMAEMLAQNWGNLDFGIVELEQRNGESIVMSYAWDLETNARQTKIFTVKHERFTRNGSYALKDPREVYELTANQGARRLRACILGIIPGDVVDAAVAECEKTLVGDNSEPMSDRIRSMVTAFAEFGVKPEMIEKRLGHKIDATIPAELMKLKQVYRSLRDNMAGVEDFFEVPKASRAPQSDPLNDRLSEKSQPPKPEDEAPPASTSADPSAASNASGDAPASSSSAAPEFPPLPKGASFEVVGDLVANRWKDSLPDGLTIEQAAAQIVDAMKSMKPKPWSLIDRKLQVERYASWMVDGVDFWKAA